MRWRVCFYISNPDIEAMSLPTAQPLELALRLVGFTNESIMSVASQTPFPGQYQENKKSSITKPSLAFVNHTKAEHPTMRLLKYHPTR